MHYESFLPAPSVSSAAVVATVTWPHGFSGAVSSVRLHSLRPLQWHLRDSWSPALEDPATPISLSQTFVEAVWWWLQGIRWILDASLQVRPRPSHCIKPRLWRAEELISSISQPQVRVQGSIPAVLLPVSWPVRHLVERQRIRCRFSQTLGFYCASVIMPDGVHHYSLAERRSIQLEARYVPRR